MAFGITQGSVRLLLVCLKLIALRWKAGGRFVSFPQPPPAQAGPGNSVCCGKASQAFEKLAENGRYYERWMLWGIACKRLECL